MKNQLKYFCLYILAAGLLSCEGDDDYQTPNGAKAYLMDDSISTFDQNEELTIRLLAENVNVETLEIQDAEGNELTTASVSGDTATFNTSALGDLTGGETIDIWMVVHLADGSTWRTPGAIHVSDALTLNPNNPASVNYLDPTERELGFTTSTAGAQVNNVSLEWRRNAGGTYADTGLTLDPEGDAIDLGQLNYDEYGLGIGDTLYYRFTAQSGDLAQQEEARVVIRTQDFNDGTEATLSDEGSQNAFNLGTGEYAEDDAEADIRFTQPQGFEATGGMQFVQIQAPDDTSTEEYLEALDLFEAEELFQQGNPLTSVNQVEEGDLYVYQVIRQDGNDTQRTYYGLIRILDTRSVTENNETIVSFDFEFTEGALLRQQ